MYLLNGEGVNLDHIADEAEEEAGSGIGLERS
jgi:hypothetical protein